MTMDDFSSPHWPMVDEQDTFADLLSPEIDDFVPDSLAAFINEAKATLRDTQVNLRAQFDSPSKLSFVDDDDITTPKQNDMIEDDEDRRLRQEVMSKFKREQALFSPTHNVTMASAQKSNPARKDSVSIKSTPLGHDLIEEHFMTPGFAQFDESGSFLEEDDFSPAIEYHEMPGLAAGASVESPPKKDSLNNLHSAETSMTRTPQVANAHLSAPLAMPLFDFNTPEIMSSPHTQNILNTAAKSSHTRSSYRNSTSTAIPQYIPSEQSDLPMALTTVSMPSSHTQQPVNALSHSLNPPKFLASDTNRRKSIYAIAEKERSTPSQLSRQKVDPVSASSPLNLPKNIATPLSILASVESSAESPQRSKVSIHHSPRIIPHKESFYDRLSKPKCVAVPSTPDAPVRARSPTTAGSLSSKSTASLKTPQHIETLAIEKTNVTPHSLEQHRASHQTFFRTTTRSTENLSSNLDSEAVNVNFETEEWPNAPREEMIFVGALSKTDARSENAMLSLPKRSERLGIGDEYLPNSKTTTYLSDPDLEETVSTQPSMERTSTSEPSSTITVSKASGRPSSLPTPKKRLQVSQPIYPSPPGRRVIPTRQTGTSSALPSAGKVDIPTRDKSRVSPDDGVAKARERIRQRQLQDKENKRRLEDSGKNNVMATKSSVRDKAISAEEGRARARQRVKLQQLQEEMKANARPRSVAPATNERKERTGCSFNSNISPAELRKMQPTIPKGPRLSISAKYGEKLTPSIQERKPTPSRVVAEVKRSLTVPIPPRLSTQAKYGDKPPPTLWEEKSKEPTNNMQSTTNNNLKPRLTTPSPFNFHESKSTRTAPTKDTQERSLAQEMRFFMEKGLREDKPMMNTKRDMTLTIPKSPNFTPLPKRSVPKSTSEKEEEMMEYYNTHPFKASQVRMSLSTAKGDVGVPKTSKRKLTVPQPFRLKSDERATHTKSNPIPTAETRSNLDLEECKKQFHARSLPNLSYRSPSALERARPKALTAPEPFRLRSDERAASVKPRQATSDELELRKQFKARPLPLSTFVAPPQRRNAAGVPMTIVTKEQPITQPPKLATAGRTEIRMAAKEASRENAEMIAKQKERMRVRKQHEKHLEEMASATLYSPTTPTDPEPFQLLSAVRHECSQHRLEVQRQKELEGEKRMRSFHARPLLLTPPPPKIQSQRPLTHPQPFRFRSAVRHEGYREKGRHEQMQLEEERRRLAIPKARPLPNFQAYKPITPMTTQKLVEPFSPELASKRRAQQRKEFDEKVARDYAEELARKKSLAEHEAAEQEADVQEKRRLPVSEGGLMYLAKPINAGLT